MFIDSFIHIDYNINKGLRNRSYHLFKNGFVLLNTKRYRAYNLGTTFCKHGETENSFVSMSLDAVSIATGGNVVFATSMSTSSRKVAPDRVNLLSDDQNDSGDETFPKAKIIEAKEVIAALASGDRPLGIQKCINDTKYIYYYCN